MPAYDIIGDIHGQADLLVALLTQMGYEERNGAWRHPEHQAIFVGDFIDRGPKQLESVMIPRRMVDAGSALAVMGNHEFDAIAWYLPDPAKPGEYLRPHFSELWGAKNRNQHAAFLREVEGKPHLHREIIDWFLELPLWLDLPGLRVVHACWHSGFMQFLLPRLRHGNRLSEELMPEITREPDNPAEKDSPEPTPFKAAEAVTKGLEIPLPDGYSFLDKYNHRRKRARVRWWDAAATTYRSAAALDDDQCGQLPDLPIPAHVQIPLPADKPIFFGHYWLTGEPQLLGRTIACVDHSAGDRGPLVAYRWNGEKTLDANHFCWVMPPG